MVEVSAREYHDTFGHLHKAVHNGSFGSDSGIASDLSRKDAPSWQVSRCSEPTRGRSWDVIEEAVCRDQASG